MSFELAVETSKRLPDLAWLIKLDRGDRLARVLAGNAVERVGRGLFAGAWSGPFSTGEMATALTAIGSGVEPGEDSLAVICGNASGDPIYVHLLGDRIFIGNMLPLVLAAADDAPLARYGFYNNDMYTIVLGSARYRAALPMSRGCVLHIYYSFSVNTNLELRKMPLRLPPPLPDFAAYRGFLIGQTAALFSNAADPARKVGYRPLAAISSGYDSPASAVIAREAGCTEGFTFCQSAESKGESDDSGEVIGRALGMKFSAFETFAYHKRDDLPETAFAAAGFGGGQVHYAGYEDFFRGRLVVGGNGGGAAWNPRFNLAGLHDVPFYLGGYSSAPFFIGLPALRFQIPAIGITGFQDIGRISRSAEMKPWSIGGAYDRPIPRRLVEEAGVPRERFGQVKRFINLGYEQPQRKGNCLDRYLSPRSLAEFERWFAAAKPMSDLGVTFHNFKVATIGLAAWSGTLTRGFRKLGIRWPRDPARVWHLRTPLRKNAFVFQWALEREIAKFKKLLAN